MSLMFPKPSRKKKLTPLEKAIQKFDVLPHTGCWQWKASINEGGYGQIHVEGKKRRAHRVIYEYLVGPVPEGLDLDHLCRNRACVNPEHLEPITRSENLFRSPLVGRVGGALFAAKQKSKTHCPKGHPYSGDNVGLQNKGRARRCLACHRKWEHLRRQRVRS